MNTEHVRCLLRKRYAAPEWALMEELAPSPGGGTKYADAVAMNLWKSRGHVVYGMEIKVSRGDWLRELKKPAKAEESVYRCCDAWYVVAAPDVVKDGELPATWGYMEVQGSRLVEKVKAPKLGPVPLDRAFTASLMRRGFEQIDRIAESRQRQAIADAHREIEERVAREISQRTRHFESLAQAVKDWEEATGLQFSRYNGPVKDVVRLAQKLDGLRFSYAREKGDSGFDFLATLAANLSNASIVIHDALAAVDVGNLPGPEGTPGAPS